MLLALGQNYSLFTIYYSLFTILLFTIYYRYPTIDCLLSCRVGLCKEGFTAEYCY